MIIQHNIMALNSYNRLAGNNSLVGKNLEKLSSGYKINRAGDDAAGLAISEKMRAQVTGLTRASQNAQDGVSLVQTAEGQLTEVHSMLNRMVDLATQSSNGTIDNNVDRKNLQKEMQALKDEIDRIADTSNFNGIKLLDGSLGAGTTGVKGTTAAGAIDAANKNCITSAVEFTVTGLEAGKTVNVQLVHGTNGADGIAVDAQGNVTVSIKGTAGRVFTQDDMNALIKNATLPESAKNLKIEMSGSATVSTTAADADTSIMGGVQTVAASKNANVTNTTTKVTVTSTVGGSEMNNKTLTFSATGTQGVTVAADGSVTVGLATGKDYSAADINALLNKAGAGMTVAFDGTRKAGAAAADTLGTTAYTLVNGAGVANGGGLSLQIGDTADQRVTVKVGNMGTAALGLSGVDVTTESAATASIQTIKDAINSVSGTRADLGAVQNRLEHTINNLSTTTENMTAAESRIRDTDMAKEMMAFTKNNVLAQAAQAMLAQANQQPQQVLQLLR